MMEKVRRADDLWGRPCLAYNVQIRFDAATRAQLSRLGRTVASRWPGALYECPPESLHISVYSLVAVRSKYDKSAYWAESGATNLGVLASACSEIGAFDVCLSELRATDTAVIATGRDDGSIERIRAALRAGVPAPPVAAPPYDLIHTTLLRYRQPQLLPASFGEDIAQLPLNVTIRVHEVVVYRERVYPSLEGDVVARLALDSRS